MKIPEKIDNVKTLLVNNAIEPKIAPILKEPVSPINIFAGGALNHKNPKPEPIIAPRKTAISPTPGT